MNAGDGSYSTYLFHSFVLGPVARVLAKLHITPPALLFAAAMVVVCTLVGYAVFKVFESRVTLYLNRQLDQILPKTPPQGGEADHKVAAPR